MFQHYLPAEKNFWQYKNVTLASRNTLSSCRYLLLSDVIVVFFEGGLGLLGKIYLLFVFPHVNVSVVHGKSNTVFPWDSVAGLTLKSRQMF